jgi:hypothetical protein
MPSYQSRYQPRRMTVIAGKILHPETYDRFYDIAYEALRDGSFPHVTLLAGRLVVRKMEKDYGIDAPRRIPPGSSTNPRNRFSGPRLDGRPGQGALYFGTIGGVLREHTHYSLAKLQPTTPIWRPGAEDRSDEFMTAQKAGAPPVDAGEKFYLFRVDRPLRFADLRLPSLAPLMTRLRASGEGARRYGIVDGSPVDFQISAVSAAQDYSAARGMADAVFDMSRTTGDCGVCALSSRADSDTGLVFRSHDDPTAGLVFALFGADSTLVPALKAVPKDPKDPNAIKDPKKLAFDTFKEVADALQS